MIKEYGVSKWLTHTYSLKHLFKGRSNVFYIVSKYVYFPLYESPLFYVERPLFILTSSGGDSVLELNVQSPPSVKLALRTAAFLSITRLLVVHFLMHVIVCKSRHGLEKKVQFSQSVVSSSYLTAGPKRGSTKRCFSCFRLVWEGVACTKLTVTTAPKMCALPWVICSALIIGCKFVLFVPNLLVLQTNYFWITQKAVSLVCGAMRPKTVRWRKVSTVRNASNRLLSLDETRKIPKVRNVLN